MKWLVIGYGNSLCADDGFGVAVAESLCDNLPNTPSISVIAQMQLLPELVEQIKESEGVIFVDADLETPKGKLNLFRLDDKYGAKRHINKIVLSHQCSPFDLIATTSALYGVQPQAWLLTTGGINFTLGEQMSKSVALLVKEAVSKILAITR
ncbi:MAG: hydrogenase maturation protease [Candidatus Obscuribacterales bacterium]|nr:hydrogenase maturation protease [Candidatus Obscuribacterales bacterium]